MAGSTMVPLGSVTRGALRLTAMAVGHGVALKLTMTKITVCGDNAVSTHETVSPGDTNPTGRRSGGSFAPPLAHHCTHASAVVVPSACSGDCVPIWGSEASR